MALAAIIGFILGSIPTALIVGKFCGVDPLAAGDKNPGWWNMRALVGDKRASIVLAGDIFKGVLAAAIGVALWGPWWIPYVAVFFAMLGHSFSLFAGLRGGRSLLTWVGGMLVLAPIPGVIAIALGAITGGVTRKFAVAALVAAFSFPLVQAFFDPVTHVAATGVLMTFIGVRFLSAFIVGKRGLSRNARASQLPV